MTRVKRSGRPKARAFRARRPQEDEDVLASFLGPLERRALEVIWTRNDRATVRDLESSFPDIAYTTLMTTLDRLHKKGVLDRAKAGRAYVYWPRYSRDELRTYLAEDAFDVLIGDVGTAADARPLLSSFVDAVSRRDSLLLDELERLVQEKRRTKPPERKR